MEFNFLFWSWRHVFIPHWRLETVSDILIVDRRVIANVFIFLFLILLICTLDLVEIIIEIGNQGFVTADDHLRSRNRMISRLATWCMSPSLARFRSGFWRRCRWIVVIFSILNCFDLPCILKQTINLQLEWLCFTWINIFDSGRTLFVDLRGAQVLRLHSTSRNFKVHFWILS